MSIKNILTALGALGYILLAWLMWSYPIEAKRAPKETQILYLFESPAVFYYIANENGDICRVNKAMYDGIKTDFAKHTYDFETCRGTKLSVIPSN